MKKIEKLLTIGFAVLLVLCTSISLIGCSVVCFDPRGREWYNSISLPSIEEPFNEIYDGCYSIQIDKDGNVLFKPLNGEEINGKLTISSNDKYSNSTGIAIEFENGKIARGSCYKTSLSIYYDNESYSFRDERQLSKEEFEICRAQFIELLINVFQTGNFPTQQEIENNDLYKEFTNYYQIDPCCGGPIVYDTVEKVTIEAIEIMEYGKRIVLDTGGERFYGYKMEEDIIVASIKNGELKELALSDVKEGECLVSLNSKGIYRIFYIENI